MARDRQEPEPGPPRPGEPLVPDAIEPVIGWRYWFLHNGTLRSLTSFVYTPWPPRFPLRAKCGSFARHLDGVPGERCSCGIYAARDLETLKLLAQAGLQGPLVVGRVAIWGRTIVSERGYRGEYGYPRELWVVRETVKSWLLEDACGQLAAAYGVPVQPCDAAWATSAEHPSWTPVHPQRATSLLRAPLLTSLWRLAILALLAALFAPLAANPLAYVSVLGVASAVVVGLIALAYGVAVGRVSPRRFAAVQLALPFVAGAAILLLAPH